MASMIPAPASAKPWDIKGTSSVTVQFEQFGRPANGVFSRFTPQIDFDAGAPKNCRIDVTIDLASIDSGNRQRDYIIRSAEFFKTDAYPHATFNAGNCRRVGENTYEAYGDLTIRDITNPVTLPFTLDIDDKGPMLAAIAKAELPLSRLDYGLGTGTFWKNSRIIGQVIRIYLTIEARVAK